MPLSGAGWMGRSFECLCRLPVELVHVEEVGRLSERAGGQAGRRPAGRRVAGSGQRAAGSGRRAAGGGRHGWLGLYHHRTHAQHAVKTR